MDKEFSYNYGDCYSNDKFVRMRLDVVKNLLSTYIKEGVKILDIGCYDGSMLVVLKKLGKKIDYTGVDADSFALNIASSRGAKVMKINFENAELTFENNYFDIIIMAEVLEHLRDPAKLIEKAKEILRPNGVILISLPNECTVYHRLKVLLGRGIDGTGFSPGYHLHFPTLNQNNKFVSDYFKIIKVGYWYHLGIGGFLEKIINLIPGFFLKSIVKLWPSFFARGVIYLCRK